MQCAAEKLMNGKTEDKVARLHWLYWEVLRGKGLTHMEGVRKLASWNDNQTLNNLSTVLGRIGVMIGLVSPQSAVVQGEDLQRITTLLETAHTFANTPGFLEKWASRPQKETLFSRVPKD